MSFAHKSSVSPARRRLLEVLQATNFGRIENLHIERGEPLFDPPPRIVREIKFGGENGPRRELSAGDFALKGQVLELFSLFDDLQDGIIESLSIKHGLPFGMHLEARA